MSTLLSTRNATDEAEPAVATDVMVCRLPGCGKALIGKQEKFCSPKHKYADFDRRHPRLNFESYIAPRPLPEDPEALKEIGIKIAVSNHRAEVAFARVAALLCLGARGSGTISHVREWAEKHGMDLPWEQNWTGGVFATPPGARPTDWWFERCGRAASFHKAGRARWVNEYALTSAGSVAYCAANIAMHAERGHGER